MEVKNFKTFFGFYLFLYHIGLCIAGAPLERFDQQKCDSLSLDDCFKNLQVFLRLTSLPFTSESKELDEYCNQCLAGYNCSTVFVENKDCLSAQNKELLPLFVQMAEFTYLMLCGDGISSDKAFLRSDYLEHSDCILRHTDALKCCAAKTDVPDLPVLRLLDDSQKGLPERRTSTCCPVSRFLQCASNVALQCGEQAANFTTNYIRRAAGEQVQMVCQEIPNYPKPDMETCPEVVPECSGSFGFPSLNNFLILILCVIVWKIY